MKFTAARLNTSENCRYRRLIRGEIDVFEKRVADVFGKFESATSDELKKLNTGVQDVSRQVTGNWDKLESVVEARVSATLNGLNIPSANDTNKLAAELKKLSAQVTALEKQLKQSTKAAAAKPAAKKTVAKKPAKGMTVAEKKKAAEAISKMKPAAKPATTS